jgi:hypothetical protein
MTSTRIPPAHGDARPVPPGVARALFGTSNAAMPRAVFRVARTPIGTPGVVVVRVAWSSYSAGREGHHGAGLRGGEAAAR